MGFIFLKKIHVEEVFRDGRQIRTLDDQQDMSPLSTLRWECYALLTEENERDHRPRAMELFTTPSHH